MHIILAAVLGSHAFGTARPDSDEDVRGVFVTPTRDLLRLRPPADTIDRREPDETYYEVGKWVRLALAANPSILELLFAETYRVQTDEGRMLVEHRDCFLSQRVGQTYMGYAVSMLRKLEKEGHFPSKVKGRVNKHALHCFRLVEQGRQLWETGTLTLRVDDPDALRAVASLSVNEIVLRFRDQYGQFAVGPTSLPLQPDEAGVEALLLRIREAHWT